MVVLNARRAGSVPGEHRSINLKPSATHPVDQYPVRHRIDRLRDTSDRANFRPPAVLQPGGWAARGVGRRRNGADTDLRRDLRSVDWRMVGSHAIAMGPASSVHVRLCASDRGRILLPVRSAARMDADPSAYLHGRDADDGASAAESL